MVVVSVLSGDVSSDLEALHRRGSTGLSDLGRFSVAESGTTVSEPLDLSSLRPLSVLDPPLSLFFFNLFSFWCPLPLLGDRI